MSSSHLDPGWVSGVPALYRSLAASLEKHYRRLVGDPDAIHEVELRWREDARRLRAAYRDFDAARAHRLAHWTGPASEAFDMRADRWSGAVSGAAEALDFAAEGLRLAVTQMPVFEGEGRRQVLAFVTAANRIDQQMNAYVAAGCTVRFADFADAVVRYARGVQANLVVLEERLDHLVASMPRRFQLGPDAPWRREIPQVYQATQLRSGNGTGFFGAKGRSVAGTIEYGTRVGRDVNGNFLVSMQLTTRGAGKAGLSAADVKKLGQKFQDWLKAAGISVTASGEGALHLSPRVTYSFRTEDEARRFLEQTGNGDNPFAAVLAQGGGVPHEISWRPGVEGSGELSASIERNLPTPSKVRLPVRLSGRAGGSVSGSLDAQAIMAIRPGVGYALGYETESSGAGAYSTSGTVTVPPGLDYSRSGPSGSLGAVHVTRDVIVDLDTHGNPVTRTDTTTTDRYKSTTTVDHGSPHVPFDVLTLDRRTTTTTGVVVTETQKWDLTPTRLDDRPTSTHTEQHQTIRVDDQALGVNLLGVGAKAEHATTTESDVLRDGYYTDAQGVRHPVPQDYPFTDPPDHTRHPGTASDTPGRFPNKR